MRRSLIALLALTAWSAASLAHAGPAGWRVEHVAEVPKGSRDVAVVASASGKRVIAWDGGDGVHVAVAKPGGRFGAGRLVRREARDVGSLRLAINSRGDALIVYGYFDGRYIAGDYDREPDCCFGARVALLRRDGRISRVYTLAPRGTEVEVEGYALDARGRFGVVWGEDYYGFRQRPGALVRFSGPHGFGPARTVDRTARGVALSLAGDRRRVLMIAYGRRRARLVERTAVGRGRFGSRREIAREVANTSLITSATNERGDEVVAWWREQFGRRPVRAGTRSPGAPLHPRAVGHSDDTEYEPPTVAIAPSGAGGVTWGVRRRGAPLVATAPGPDMPFARGRAIVPPQPSDGLHVATALAVDSRGEVAVKWIVERSSHLVSHAAVRTARGRTIRHVVLDRTLGYTYGGTERTAALDGKGRATVAFGQRRVVAVAVTRVSR